MTSIFVKQFEDNLMRATAAVSFMKSNGIKAEIEK